MRNKNSEQKKIKIKKTKNNDPERITQTTQGENKNDVIKWMFENFK